MNYQVCAFGADPEGKLLSTAAIQAAIDACAASGGGRVTLPQGTFVSGTLWLRSRVELHLEEGAVLRGSDEMEDYNEIDAYEQNFSSEREKWLGKHLIVALECEDVAITGLGVLDGNADHFVGEGQPFSSVYVWNGGVRRVKSTETLRPGQLVCFVECSRVTVRDVTLLNQPCWGLLFHGSKFITVRGVRIFNDPRVLNTDGIDLDSCKYATVSDCIIDTGDDAIAIRASYKKLKHSDGKCESITISNCHLASSSSAVRIGVGAGKICHIRFSNLTISRGAPAIQIMSSYRGRGNTSIEDVHFSHISARGLSRPLEITEESPNRATIRDITIDGFDGECYGFLHFLVSNTDTVEHIVLRSWRLRLVKNPFPMTPRSLEEKGEVWMNVKNTKGLRLEDFAVTDPEGCLSAWEKGPFLFENCPELILNNVTLNGKEIQE